MTLLGFGSDHVFYLLTSIFVFANIIGCMSICMSAPAADWVDGGANELCAIRCSLPGAASVRLVRNQGTCLAAARFHIVPNFGQIERI